MKNVLIISLGAILCFACNNKSNQKTTSVVPDFIKIVNGQTTISDSSVICELSLRKLSERLQFDAYHLMGNAKEYEWGVYFDNDNNGTYDLSFSISNWKSKGETERIGEPIKNTQSNIWRITKEGGLNIGDLDAKIEGDKVILTALNRTKELREISSNSKVKYQTYYYDGTDSYMDSLIIRNK